jgi:hypothetical protein
MVEVDYAANGRKSLARVKHAAAHLKEFFDACAKTRVITSDRISAYQAERLGLSAKPATVNYELAVLRRAFGSGVAQGKSRRGRRSRCYMSRMLARASLSLSSIAPL